MRRYLLMSVIFVFGITVAHASVFKGQRFYMKLCKKCHKSGGKLTLSHSQEEWNEFFEKDAKKLIEVHKNNNEAMKELNSSKFKKNQKHIKHFFLKYAKDSGNVPACN
ncbi:cytochrome C [Hydrogenimonas sp.]